MKNPHLTFYRKVNQQAVTAGLGSPKLVAKPTENVERIVVTYPRCRKSACSRSQSLVRPIRNRQVASSTLALGRIFRTKFPHNAIQ